MFPSSSFIPVLRGQWFQREGHSAAGVALYGEARQIGLSVITLDLQSVPTSIRADKSGSKSRAEEETVNGRILVNTQVAKGDKLLFSGRTFRVQSVFPRYDMAGRVDHWQLDLVIWVDK